MIRPPDQPRRQAKLTMEVLGDFQHAHRDVVEIVLFGTDEEDPMFQALQREFAWRDAGVLRRQELASLMNEIDLFVDFSSFQAMGLAALKPMACGAAVVNYPDGGATSFARNDVNSLVIDTSTADSVPRRARASRGRSRPHCAARSPRDVRRLPAPRGARRVPSCSITYFR